MCIFYLLHELTGFNPEIPDGKRNTRIFIFGIIIYCLIYIFLINLSHNNIFDKNICDAIFWCGLILFLSDVFIMGYTYRNYYGRSITNELITNEDKWLYDEKKHKFYDIKKGKKNNFTNNKYTNKNDIEQEYYLSKSNILSKTNLTDNSIKLKTSKISEINNFIKSLKTDKSDKIDKLIKSEKLDKSLKSEKLDKSLKSEISEISDKSNKSIKSEKI